MAVTETVHTAWQANQKVNLLLLQHLDEDMLKAVTPGGGYSVAQHLAHMVCTVKYWGCYVDESLNNLPDLFYNYNDDTDEFQAVTDLEQITRVMLETLERAYSLVNTIDTMGEAPYLTADAYLIHMMVHDAHHRGQILLALKTSGYTLPDEGSFWMPWKIATSTS
ncbi:MAG: DinB family protein [Deinococcota bacterium]